MMMMSARRARGREQDVTQTIVSGWCPNVNPDPPFIMIRQERSHAARRRRDGDPVYNPVDARWTSAEVLGITGKSGG